MVHRRNDGCAPTTMASRPVTLRVLFTGKDSRNPCSWIACCQEGVHSKLAQLSRTSMDAHGTGCMRSVAQGSHAALSKTCTPALYSVARLCLRRELDPRSSACEHVCALYPEAMGLTAPQPGLSASIGDSSSPTVKSVTCPTKTNAENLPVFRAVCSVVVGGFSTCCVFGYKGSGFHRRLSLGSLWIRGSGQPSPVGGGCLSEHPAMIALFLPDDTAVYGECVPTARV